MSDQQHRIPTSLDGVDFHHPEAFWFGAVATTVGVLLHLPMYIGAADMGYRLVGMPVDMPMLVGMFLIIVGSLAPSMDCLLQRAATLSVLRYGSVCVRLMRSRSGPRMWAFSATPWII